MKQASPETLNDGWRLLFYIGQSGEDLAAFGFRSLFLAWFSLFPWGENKAHWDNEQTNTCFLYDIREHVQVVCVSCRRVTRVRVPYMYIYMYRFYPVRLPESGQIWPRRRTSNVQDVPNPTPNILALLRSQRCFIEWHGLGPGGSGLGCGLERCQRTNRNNAQLLRYIALLWYHVCDTIILSTLIVGSRRCASALKPELF